MYEHYKLCCATFCFVVFGVAVVITVVVFKGKKDEDGYLLSV